MTDQHPRTYWTADRSVLVEEGDPRAAFLAYGSADPIPPEHLDLLNGKPITEPGPETIVPETDGVILPQPKPKPTRKPKG